ncbi:hypothetical protein GYO_2894 [Bacillus spizizenii TU-B-10]|uniref:Uncharacterized protein n=1 Tax=Bacillus spizizenii (strain DSM 15029 / JCM 12233 / NBRC 101239 / NRRL B-23049 / TU-B-10) TaxID=1052585 RepID=G4NXR1_BACS4|nr:hypothetical protein GYO_2894 [Bacillus spizizenii TU-B-10]
MINQGCIKSCILRKKAFGGKKEEAYIFLRKFIGIYGYTKGAL